MKIIHYAWCLLAGGLAASAALGASPPDPGTQSPAPPLRVLLYDDAATGAHVVARTNLREALSDLAQEKGFELVMTRNYQDITYSTLKTFHAFVLSNGDGEILPDPENREGVDRYLREGGGLLAIHAAAAHLEPSSLLSTLISRPWLRTLAPSKASVLVQSDAARGPLAGLVGGLPAEAELTERWMEFGDVTGTDGGTVVLRSGELKHRGETISGQPLVWVRHHEDGRIVYNALGKENVYDQAGGYGRKLLWNSLRYVTEETLGAKPAALTDLGSSMAKTSFLVEGGDLRIVFDGEGGHRVLVRDIKGRLLLDRMLSGPGIVTANGLRGILHVRVENASGHFDRKIVVP